MRTNNDGMEYLFNPKSIAVIGASENPEKLGYQVMKSLTMEEQPSWNTIPINPGKKEIMGIKVLPSVLEVKEEIDLAIVLLPAYLVPGKVKECVAKKVKAIILITTGFKEIEDPQGNDLQKEVAELANKAKIPIIGPNSFGLFNVSSGMNATFNSDFPTIVRKGKIALLSQSGGMAGIFGYLSKNMNIGFSKIISLGNRCNVDFAEMLGYLMEDLDTEVIAMYIEGIDNPRQLLKVAAQFRGRKPIIVYKVGRSRVSDSASQSHTGSLSGRYEIYQGAFRQAGLLTVDSSIELLDVAKALGLSLLPKGPNVAVLSGQAGPAMAACDVCEARGLKISPFNSESQTKLNNILPPISIRTNPVDLGPSWNNISMIKKSIQVILKDKITSSLLLFFVFSSVNEDNFFSLSEAFERNLEGKPIIASFHAPLGGKWENEIRSLEESNILLNYPTPERAAMALAALWEYKKIWDLRE
jgi:acyl-CoA synthetase (NDP forming)